MFMRMIYIGGMAALCLVALGCSKNTIPATVSTNAAVDKSLPQEQQILQAADGGNLTALNSLLQKNPQLATATDQNGDTPLHLLMRHRYWDAKSVQALLKGGCAADMKGGQGASPLDIADENMAPPEIMQLLRSGGAAPAK